MTAKADGLPQETFIIERTFAAPRALVFDAFTQARHLVHWWGPKGFAVTHAKIDLRPGGTFHYGLKSPQGQEMWGKWLFREIVAPEKLVLVSSFSDPQEGTTRAFFSNDWPLLTLSTFSFVAEGTGTRVTLTAHPIEASASERALFQEMHKSMQGGYGGTFQQLEAYLKAPSAA